MGVQPTAIRRVVFVCRQGSVTRTAANSWTPAENHRWLAGRAAQLAGVIPAHSFHMKRRYAEGDTHGVNCQGTARWALPTGERDSRRRAEALNLSKPVKSTSASDRSRGSGAAPRTEFRTTRARRSGWTPGKMFPSRKRTGEERRTANKLRRSGASRPCAGSGHDLPLPQPGPGAGLTPR